jgi:hypothetical protein
MERWEVPEGWEWKQIREVVQDTERSNPSARPDESFFHVDIAALWAVLPLRNTALWSHWGSGTTNPHPRAHEQTYRMSSNSSRTSGSS